MLSTQIKSQSLPCFASKKILTEKAGEYEKRGLSLFLALALCLTLLPAAAFADSKSETSAPHTHYLATDLILEYPITIAEDITLCLSGNGITINANENAFEVI